MCRPADEPLATVDHVIVSIGLDAQRKLRRIRARHIRLGHTDAGSDLAGEERLQPRLLLLRCAELREHLHVAGVRCRAVHRLGCDRAPAGDLGERRVLDIAEAGTEALVGEEQVPQPSFARLRLELLDHRRDALRRRLSRELLPVPRLGGTDALVDERPEPLAKLLDALRLREIHISLLDLAPDGASYRARLRRWPAPWRRRPRIHRPRSCP